jgi:hypothetical protein
MATHQDCWIGREKDVLASALSVFVLSMLFIVGDADWITHSDPALPREDRGMAVGYYDDSLYLFGGDDYKQQLVEYDMNNNTFIDHGSSNLSVNEFGRGVYFTQMNSTTLYTIQYWAGDTISVYDLPSLSYSALNTTIPTAVTYDGCIASSETPSPRLYITGGYNSLYPNDGSLDSVQVFDLDTETWLNVSSMQYARHYHGCIVVDDMLYVMGGYYNGPESNDARYVYEVEVINTTNIEEAEWEVIGNYTAYSFGVTAVDGVIYMVGGIVDVDFIDTVYTIDTATNNVSLHGDELPSALCSMPIVAVDHVIYGFGGRFWSDYKDSWMSYNTLPTPEPTKSPTAEPTLPPSLNPTAAPSLEPTVPTKDPTSDPTEGPTSSPTDGPSLEPTVLPTVEVLLYSTEEAISTDEAIINSADSVVGLGPIWFNIITAAIFVNGDCLW